MRWEARQQQQQQQAVWERTHRRAGWMRQWQVAANVKRAPSMAEWLHLKQRYAGAASHGAWLTSCVWAEVLHTEAHLQLPSSPSASTPCDGSALPLSLLQCDVLAAWLQVLQVQLRCVACQLGCPRVCACGTLHGVREASQAECGYALQQQFAWDEDQALHAGAGSARVLRGWSTGGARVLRGWSARDLSVARADITRRPVGAGFHLLFEEN
jgi:hypothetical protein